MINEPEETITLKQIKEIRYPKSGEFYYWFNSVTRNWNGPCILDDEIDIEWTIGPDMIRIYK